MRQQPRVQRLRRHGEHVVRLAGQVDGSTACWALALVAEAPPRAQIVIDLSELTGAEAFGVEVFVRGLRRLTRDRCVRIAGLPRHLDVLAYLADSLSGQHAT